MKLKVKYLAFIIVLHLVFLILSLQLLQLNRYLFLLAELLILISIIISVVIYRQLIQPVETLSSGLESLKDQDFSLKFVKVGHREIDQLIDVYNKMIDQLRSERIKQKEQHYFLEKLIQASPSGLILLDLDGRIETVNPAGAVFLQASGRDLEGKLLTGLPGKLAQALVSLQVGQAETVQLSGMQTYKCQKASFLDQGFPRQFILIEPVTSEIVKSEKQAYEKVIRLMSHEINNSIGAINSILSSLLAFHEKLNSQEGADFRQGIEVAIERNIHLNRFMANFAEVVRLPRPVLQDYDLHKLLESAYRLIKSELENRRITWRQNLLPGPFIVKIDVQQFEQVLVNIFRNAMEAIEEEGQIEIISGRDNIPYLLIRDDGRDIPGELQTKLFTPFFSTKQKGQGIGLTLSREILLNHDCDFSLMTLEPGVTEFRIYFN